jgi:predicted DNA-binding protein (MmcQ/YjbR family)
MFIRFPAFHIKHIVTGYYMNKEHWNSVYLDVDVPDAILKQMIDMSYDLVFNSLSKKLQKQILSGSNSA